MVEKSTDLDSPTQKIDSRVSGHKPKNRFQKIIHSENFRLGLFIFLLSALFALAALIAYKAGPNILKTKDVTLQELAEPTVIMTNQTQEEQVDGWKIYRNDGYGFEVNYPADYFVLELEAGGITIAHSKWKENLVHHPYVAIQIVKTELSIDEWVEQKINEKLNEGYEIMEDEGCMHCVSKSAEETTVGNDIRALSYRVWGASGGSEFTIVKKDTASDWLIEIDDHTAGSQAPDEASVPRDVFNQILSTFRFLE